MFYVKQSGNTTSEPMLDAVFKRNLHGMVNGDHTLMDLATFDLIFFPIMSNNSYYLLCFDIKKPSIFIIDNLDKQKQYTLPRGEEILYDKHIKEYMMTAMKVIKILFAYKYSID